MQKYRSEEIHAFGKHGNHSTHINELHILQCAPPCTTYLQPSDCTSKFKGALFQLCVLCSELTERRNHACGKVKITDFCVHLKNVLLLIPLTYDQLQIF